MSNSLNFDKEEVVKIPRLRRWKLLGDPNMVHEIRYQPNFTDKKETVNNSIFDDKLQINDSYIKRSPQSTIVQIIICMISIFFGSYLIYSTDYNIGAIVFGSVFISIGLIKIILYQTKPGSKDFILDRFNGILKYPNAWWYKPVVTYFEDSSIILFHEGKFQRPTLKARTNGFLSFSYKIVNFYPNQFWSFMVWYMDKNRPLPPGSAFDAYRQQDFERRKAEGFPPPLYYSCGILTPEATPEQQAEREQFWKDREYFAPQIKRPENSEIFHTRTHTHWVKTSFTDKNDLPVIDTWYEFTAEDGNIVYMLTDDQGKGYSPPKEQNYTAVRLTITERWW